MIVLLFLICCFLLHQKIFPRIIGVDSAVYTFRNMVWNTSLSPLLNAPSKSVCAWAMSIVVILHNIQNSMSPQPCVDVVRVRQFHAGCYSVRISFFMEFFMFTIPIRSSDTFSLIKLYLINTLSFVSHRSYNDQRIEREKTAITKSEPAKKTRHKVSGSRYELNCRYFHLFIFLLFNFKWKKFQCTDTGKQERKMNNHLKPLSLIREWNII